MLLMAARPLAGPVARRDSASTAWSAVDLFRGEDTVDRPNIVVDVTGVVRLADGWRLYVRPWFRQPRTAEWDKEIYQAAIQYERSGHGVDARRRRLHRLADRPRDDGHAARASTRRSRRT